MVDEKARWLMGQVGQQRAEHERKRNCNTVVAIERLKEIMLDLANTAGTPLTHLPYLSCLHSFSTYALLDLEGRMEGKSARSTKKYILKR